MSRHTTFQPISVRHTSLWQCRTPLTYALTNQRSPHAALATPYSANFRSNQSAFATRRSGNAELRHLCSHQPARATRRICHAARYPLIRRRVPPYQISGSSPFVALVRSKSTQVVIPSRILASVTSTRLISVTDHRASASSHARRPLELPEPHATPSRRRISPATPVYFLYPESILFHVRFPTYDALPPRHPGQPSRLPLYGTSSGTGKPLRIFCAGTSTSPQFTS